MLTGNLYISGRDPSFHYEHAVLLARELNYRYQTGYRRSKRRAGLYDELQPVRRALGDQLYDTLDSTLRSDVAARA